MWTEPHVTPATRLPEKVFKSLSKPPIDWAAVDRKRKRNAETVDVWFSKAGAIEIRE